MQPVEEELGGEVGVGGVQLAALDAPGHELAHERATTHEGVLLAHAGLVEQHVVKRVVLLGPVEQTRRELLDRGSGGGFGKLAEGRLDRRREALDVPSPQLGQQLGLRREVQVDRSFGNSGHLGDLGDGGVDPVLDEHPLGAVEDLGPPHVGGLAPPGAGDRVAHGPSLFR